MSLLQQNATIAVSRQTYDPGTKKTGAPAVVAGLEAVPVFVQEFGSFQRARGFTPEFDLKMAWDAKYAIHDGDRITGYNPIGLAVPPILQIVHVEASGVGTPAECRVSGLTGEKGAGQSR